MSKKNQYGRPIEDSISTLSDMFATVDGETSSSDGFSDYYDYPEGFNVDNSIVIGFEIITASDTWRSGVATHSTTVGRCYVELADEGVRVYRNESNTASKAFRVTLMRLR